MTIKQQGGIFGRNPTFNDLTVEGTLTTSGSIEWGAGIFESLTVDTNTLYVDASNNATLVGTTTWNTVYDPKLQVEGTSGDGTQGILVSSYKPSVTFFDFSGGTPAVHRIAADSGKLSFEIDTAQNGTFTEAFGVTAAGNIAMANGKGIDFSATSGTGTSELFDDYEEGTWTPVISDATSGGNTGTATVAYATYTKVGNLVHLKARLLNMNTTGMGSGNLYVQGAPYAADGDGEGLASMSHFTAAANSLGIVPSIDDGASHIKLKEIISGGVYINADSSQFNSGTADLWITITYHT